MFNKYYAYEVVSCDGKVIGCEVVKVRLWVNPVELISKIRVQSKYQDQGILNLRRIK